MTFCSTSFPPSPCLPFLHLMSFIFPSNDFNIALFYLPLSERLIYKQSQKIHTNVWVRTNKKTTASALRPPEVKQRARIPQLKWTRRLLVVVVTQSVSPFCAHVRMLLQRMPEKASPPAPLIPPW